MKKQFAALPKADQKRIESAYHRMKPEELDKVMSQAKARGASHVNRSVRSKPRRNKVSDKKRAA